MKKLVVVIDAQYDFMMQDGKLPVPGAEALIAPGIRYLANLKPEETAGVLFTFDTHTAAKYLGSAENVGDPDNGIPGFPLHCEKGTPGWENVFNYKLIHEDIPTFTLEKGVFNMWEETGVGITPIDLKRGRGYSNDREMFFTQLARYGVLTQPVLDKSKAVDTVQIFGVASDFCVRWAIDGFLKRGFKVEVVEHLTAGILKTAAEVAAEDDYKAVVLV